MKKSLVMMLALSGTMLVSCTQSEYVGEAVQQGTNNAIVFGGGAGRMTRADKTGADAATLLDNQMKVYGVKQNAETTTNYDKVFVDYSVKYNTGMSSYDEYNNGWYYVGAETGQTIKYWDWASADYHFVAGSPVANFTYALDATTGDIKEATVTGLGGRLTHETSADVDDAVYIADPVVVAKTAYKDPVKFTFKSQQSKVRVGIYETINGYEITEIEFYNNDATPAKSNYVTLNSATTDYFQGGTVSGTVTYDWTTSPASYTFAYGTDATLKFGKYWEGGKFTGVQATSSADAIAKLYGADDDYDANTGYFIVMQTPVATAAPLTIKCDYTLKSTDGSDETIKVKGATATIPAEYTKWEANKAYTYLFKITKDTNGKTDPDQPEDGLYPITFDAVVVDVADAFVGTETTVTTPSITVYQDGDVVTNGITYKAGDVVVTAMEETATGVADVTADYTWSYMQVAAADFDYTKNYNDQDGTWQDGKLTTVAADNVYVIRATKTTGDPADPVVTTAYFVLVVGAPESN